MLPDEPVPEDVVPVEPLPDEVVPEEVVPVEPLPADVVADVNTAIELVVVGASPVLVAISV